MKHSTRFSSAIAVLVALMVAPPLALAQESLPPPPADAPQVAPPAQVAPAPRAPPYAPVYEEAPEPQRALNTIYGEVLGAGLFWSVNYERLVLDDLAVRVGFGYIGASGYDTDGSRVTASLITIPLTVSYLGIGNARHIFEIGGGATLIGVTAAVDSGVSRRSGAGLGAWGTIFAGYRVHPVDGAGFHFRVGAMGLMARGLSLSSEDPDAFGVLPWAYLGAGGSF